MKLIPQKVADKFARPLLHLQKQSPQVMFVAGVVGSVGAVVLASRATLTLSDKLAPLEGLKEKSEFLHDQWKEQPTDDEDAYTDKKYAKDQMVIRIKTILAITKHYAPSAGLMMLSIGLLTGSHATLNRRNASLTAAYASVDKAFEKYRSRVVDTYGVDADREFRYGAEKVKETVEGDDGKKKTVTTTTADFGDKPSMYARLYDEYSTEWKRDADYNRAYLHCQQNYANERLRTRGHLFLNEVYDSLGLERTPEGQIVGWVLDGDGDGYVDFNIFDNLANEDVRAFMQGREYSVMLDFNVDGVVWDKI
jgi:hypothetical protein